MKARKSPLKGLLNKNKIYGGGLLPEVEIKSKRKKTGVSFATSYHYAKKRKNTCKKCKGKPNCVCPQ